MRIHRLRNLDDYERYYARERLLIDQHIQQTASLAPPKREPFNVSGYSHTAGKNVAFNVTYDHAGPDGPLWRETVNCPITHFNNRMRATVQIFDIEMGIYKDSRIYLTEQVTPLWNWFKNAYPKAEGSEFLRDSTPLGTSNKNGIRNEDLTRLTFADEMFDAIISLDVLEHVPEYQKAFNECHRILKPGGRLFWSVPFIREYKQNIVRAEMRDGQIHHILTPEYHGDPLSGNDCLCFTYFGWDMLDEVRALGFTDVYALTFYSTAFGYYGIPHIFFSR